MTIECPSCGFVGATLSAEGTRTCSRCGNKWDAPLEYPARPPVAPPRRSRWKPNAERVEQAVLAVVLVAVFGLCALVWAISETAPLWVERPAANDVAAVPSPGSNAPPKRPIEGTAAIGPNVGQGRSRDAAWWLVEYRNTGGTTIALPQVELSLATLDGVGREVYPATIDALPPGHSTWLLLRAGTWQHDAAATFKVIGPHAALPSDAVFTRLDVTHLEWVKQSKNDGVLRCDVANALDHQVTFYSVSAVGFNLDGTPCAYAQAFPPMRPLSPGESLTIELPTGIWQSELPATWEVHAWAHYRGVLPAQE